MVHAAVSRLIHDEYPWMSMVAVSQIARAGASVIKTESTHRSRLLDLPPEIRNQINELVLIDGEPIRIGAVEIDQPTLNLVNLAGMLSYKPQRSPYQPGITRVSRQLRQETLSLFYGSNTFSGRFSMLARPCSELIGRGLFSPWLQAIGSRNRQLLSHVVVEVPAGLTEERVMTDLAKRDFLFEAGVLELVYI